MKTRTALMLLLVVCLGAQPLYAQTVPEGVGQGYEGELGHVASQLIALAEATPAEKFAFRPASGVRSTGEVYMHIVFANYYLLSQTGVGPKMPADLKPDAMKTVPAKAELIDWLKRSLDALKSARAAAKPADLERKVTLFKHETTADAVFLRLIIHNNEHMGQLIAYARMSGVAPPWSKD